LITGAAAIAALAACSRQAAKTESDPAGAAASDPAAVIGPLYDRYMTEDAQFPDFQNQAPWSTELWRELQAMSARSEALNEPILDFDPLIDGQDYQLANLNVATESLTQNSHAVVRASFENLGEHKEVVYDLIWQDGAWRVDNIRTATWDLRQIAAAPNADAIPRQ
jgi:hypothetical protein